MFERFTERARQAVILAQEEARGLRHNYIGTEHLLLGLVREDEGLAARVLASLGVITLEEVRTSVVRIVGEGDTEITAGGIPFDPDAKKVLELSLREALAIGHNYIGTEHILLALVCRDVTAIQVLTGLEVSADEIRSEITRLLGANGSRARTKASVSMMAQSNTRTRRTALAKVLNEAMVEQTVGELLDSLIDQDDARADLSTKMDAAVRALTVGELIDVVTIAKETRIENREFDRAAAFRDIERKVVMFLKSIQPSTEVDQTPPQDAID